MYLIWALLACSCHGRRRGPVIVQLKARHSVLFFAVCTGIKRARQTPQLLRTFSHAASEFEIIGNHDGRELCCLAFFGNHDGRVSCCLAFTCMSLPAEGCLQTK